MDLTYNNLRLNSKDDDDDNEANEGEDPTGRERVQNALGEDTSSAAVTRSKMIR